MSEPKPRPEGVRFWDATDVVDWVKANIKYDKVKDGDEQLAIWWHACEQAETYRDLNLRETAEMLVSGVKPLTLDDITEELQLEHEDYPGQGCADVDADIEQRLRKHFGLDIQEMKTTWGKKGV